MGHVGKGFLGVIVVLCASVSLRTLAFDDPGKGKSNYTLIDLGGLAGSRFANANGINNSGQIVGTSANHAFLWEKGVMKDLGTLGGNLSVANAINDQSQVVGESETARGEKHAFLWANGVMTDLGIAGETSTAHGINNQGEIVGATFAKNVRGGAMLWKNGARQPLGDLGPSGSGSTALAINDKGEIAGVSSGFASNHGVVRAVIWEQGTIRDIGTLGGEHSSGNGVNRGGEVVGWAEIADKSTDAFIWQNGLMHDLGRLPASAIKPGSGSQAAGINDHGVVVGSSLDADGRDRAVIWQSGKIADLNEWVPKGSSVILTAAKAINNRGHIVVEQQSGDGPSHAFLLTPKQ